MPYETPSSTLAFYEGEVNRLEKELKCLGHPGEPGLRHKLAYSMVCKASALSALNFDSEAMQVCDDLVERLGKVSELDVQVHIAEGMYIKGTILRKVGQSDKAIQTLGEIVGRFADS